MIKKINKLVKVTVIAAIFAITVNSVLWAEYTLLSSTDPVVRMREAQRLGNELDRESLPQLIALLEDNSSGVRLHAAVSLGRIGDRSALPALLNALNSDQSAAVRIMTAQALGGFREKKAVEALVEAVAEGDENTRPAAIRALGRSGGEEVLDILVEKAKDHESSRVRVAALDSLAEMLISGAPDDGDTVRIERALTEAADEGEPTVKNAALRGLRRVEETRERGELLR